LFSCVSIDQRTGVDKAVRLSSNGISRDIKTGSKIAILDIQEIWGVNRSAAQTNLSVYALDFLTKRLVDTQRFIIVDKTSLEIKKPGITSQSPGGISDNMAIVAGKVLGADVVVTGAIIHSGGTNYLRVKTLEVDTGQILSMTYESIMPGEEKALERASTRLSRL
jgi:hypothetical protein